MYYQFKIMLKLTGIKNDLYANNILSYCTNKTGIIRKWVSASKIITIENCEAFVN